jgi:hypothetical protein
VTIEQIEVRPDLQFRRRSRLTLLAIAVVLIVPVVWFGLAHHNFEGPTAFDEWAIRWTQNHRMTDGPLHFVMLESTGFSFAGTAALVAIIAVAAFRRVGRPRVMWSIVAAQVATALLVEVIGKPIFHRTIRGVNAYPAGSSAFATQVAITLATIAWMFSRRRRSWITVFLAMIALSMAPKLYFAILNQQHYLSDLIAGVAVGLAVSLTSLAVASRAVLNNGSDAIKTSAGSDT